jgi:NAD(P)-dependent dehydrogenase (short-subunit alcohol dehydrogenase family)
METINQTVAIVTGAGSGMGTETARQLAKEGAKVVLLDKSLQKAGRVAQEIQGIALPCDVSQANEVESAITQAKTLGSIRVCVNCAGIAPGKRIVGKDGPMPLEEFIEVIQINLVGAFNVMRCAANAMMQTQPMNQDGERGIIINTASIAAYEGQIGQSAYSASKGGVISMTLPAAREFAPWGIRVVTIAPGAISTPMVKSMPQSVQENLLASLLFPKRFGEAKEYAELVKHIIHNPFLNGSVIRLDGGLRLR